MCSIISRFGLLFFILMFHSLSFGAERYRVPADLALQSQWLRLVHYEPDSTSASGWRSAIHSADFFLSPQGASDPTAELEATLRAFDIPINEDSHDQHAQCRFPARLQWLRQILKGYEPSPRIVRCPAFAEWTRKNSIESISIVFATGFLGNPASYYGHTLLKFNFRGETGRSGLMDVSVNYGAILEGTNDSMPIYLVKSLVGGYDAGFSHVQFYFHNHNYGDNELRDMWEYQLDLPQEAVGLVTAHAWEVLGKRYTYYFFRSNCAYRMAELVQVVDGIEFIPQDRPWVIPQALVQQLKAATYKGRPLVSNVIYHPSRQSRYYARYSNLSVAEKVAFRSAAKTEVTSESFADHSLQSRQNLLDTLIDYYQFAHNPLSEATAEARKQYASALAARYQLPPGASNLNSKIPESPDEGRSPGWIQFYSGHNSAKGSLSGIRIRAAYYDPLDGGSGHVPYGALSMGDTQLDFVQGRIRLRRIDAIKIESVSPGLSGLPGDDGKVWKIKAGIEQSNLSCDHCLVPQVQGDIGIGAQSPSGYFGGLYIGGGLQSSRSGQGIAFVRPSGTLIYKPDQGFGASLSYEYRFSSGARADNRGVMVSEARWPISRAADVRITYEHDKATQMNVGIGAYW